MAVDDSFMRARPQSTLPTGHAASVLARKTVVELPAVAEPEPSAVDDFASLPQPGSAYDAAHSRASNKPVPTLSFVIGDTIRGLPNANYDSIDWVVPEKPEASPFIVMRFTGLVPREAVIAGRNLLKLYDLLSNHRVSWVRELPKGKDFLDKGMTVVTSITVGRITEMPG
jgi:hypothetical protein